MLKENQNLARVFDETRLWFAGPTLLRKYANGFWVVTKRQEHEGNPFVECDVNQTGQFLLEELRGGDTLGELVEKFCKRYSLVPSKNYVWIREFIEELVERGVIVCQDLGHGKNTLRVLGDTEKIFPPHVSIEVTEKCNLRCSFCYLSAGPLKVSTLSFEKIISLFEELEEGGTTGIDLTGGEFFLHPRAIDILEEACNRFVLVGLLTNGTHLPDKAFDILYEHRDHVIVNVSLDSVDPQLHNKVRGGKKAFEKTTGNIRRLSEKGIRVRVASVIFEDNMWEVDALAALSLELGAYSFSFNFVEGFGRGSNFKDKNGVNIDAEYRKYIEKVINDYKDHIPVIYGEQIDKNRLNCGAGTSGISISSDGYVRPCPLFPKTRKMGNVNAASLKDLFEKPVYKELLSVPMPSITSGCDTNCEFLPNCSSCYLKGLSVNRERKPEDYCSWVKANNLQEIINLILPDQTKLIPLKEVRNG